ncbi:uncharacterized protein BKA78DRAFT_57912 [Phyllosticta capitalensis]|uniref:uncharacterized protein n=1 Tax=Phyllosticta capitalensis TaxID=121624 RepID=UPI00312EC164
MQMERRLKEEKGLRFYTLPLTCGLAIEGDYIGGATPDRPNCWGMIASTNQHLGRVSLQLNEKKRDDDEVTTTTRNTIKRRCQQDRINLAKHGRHTSTGLKRPKARKQRRARDKSTPS